MDEKEHEIPYSYIEFMHSAHEVMGAGAGSLVADDEKKEVNLPSPSATRSVIKF